MTLTRFFWPLLLILALSSCDKIKETVSEVSASVEEGLEDRLSDPDAEPELSPLMRWVDENEEGIVFRKDLPFPPNVKVVTDAKKRINGRIFYRSELGQKVETLEGKESITVSFQRKDSSVTYSIEDSKFSIPKKGGDEKEESIKNPFGQAPPPDQAMTYVLGESGWKGKTGGDFKLKAMSQKLSPVFGELLVDNALEPRKLWFSPSRMKIGDEITLSDAALPMIVPGKVTGTLKIRLMEIGDVEGHPCGMFSVSGEYTRQGFPSLQGHLMDQEVTVESGELWLSLLYPMILKEKLKTIQTFRPSDSGSIVGKAQGTVDTLIIRKWEARLPDPAFMPKSEPEADPEVVEPDAEAAEPSE